MNKKIISNLQICIKYIELETNFVTGNWKKGHFDVPSNFVGLTKNF